MRNRTEIVITEAFERLLEERPLTKITVKDIVERCGVNRNTFYYHFQDIPSLIERSLKEKADQIILDNCRLESPLDCIRLVIQYCSDHKRAGLHIYRSVQREVFLDALERVALYAVTEYVETATAGMEISPTDKRLLIGYYKCTLTGAALDWLDAGMEYDLLAAAERICELFAGAGKQAILKCAGSCPAEQD
jgi:AcrR family transcriptional regulator